MRFAPELMLLLACSHPESDRESKLGMILALSLDWDRLLRLANQHRLLPPLYSALHGRNDIPASIHSAVIA